MCYLGGRGDEGLLHHATRLCAALEVVRSELLRHHAPGARLHHAAAVSAVLLRPVLPGLLSEVDLFGTNTTAVVGKEMGRKEKRSRLSACTTRVRRSRYKGKSSCSGAAEPCRRRRKSRRWPTSFPLDSSDFVAPCPKSLSWGTLLQPCMQHDGCSSLNTCCCCCCFVVVMHLARGSAPY